MGLFGSTPTLTPSQTVTIAWTIAAGSEGVFDYLGFFGAGSGDKTSSLKITSIKVANVERLTVGTVGLNAYVFSVNLALHPSLGWNVGIGDKIEITVTNLDSADVVVNTIMATSPSRARH